MQLGVAGTWTQSLTPSPPSESQCNTLSPSQTSPLQRAVLAGVLEGAPGSRGKGKRTYLRPLFIQIGLFMLKITTSWEAVELPCVKYPLYLDQSKVFCILFSHEPGYHYPSFVGKLQKTNSLSPSSLRANVLLLRPECRPASLFSF